MFQRKGGPSGKPISSKMKKNREIWEEGKKGATHWPTEGKGIFANRGGWPGSLKSRGSSDRQKQ